MFIKVRTVPTAFMPHLASSRCHGQSALFLFVPILLLIVTLMWLPTGLHAEPANDRLVNLVNPFIGTGPVNASSLSGNNFPGATTPFGFVQLSPDTEDAPHGVCSGYDYNDKMIYGFSHTHLSGTGISDLFDVLVMPATGSLDIKSSNTFKAFRSSFKHNQESASPGYYQVNLLDYKVNAELTASEHVGFHRYTFPQGSQAHILIDLNHSFDKKRTWYPCKILEAQVSVVNSHTIEGHRTLTGWGNGYRRVYFRAEFSQPFIGNTMVNSGTNYNGIATVNGKSLQAVLDFNTETNAVILVKVGLSATSIENTRLNLSSEAPDWDFDKTRKAAADLWETELEKIVVEGTTEQKEIFYTGLYHAFIQPNNIADVNGDYPASDMTVHHSPGQKFYSTFSLWDTYRAANPLYTLVQPKRTAGIVNSMLQQYDVSGYLPIWQLWGLENYCMIGNHAIPVIVDAALKGIKGFDLERAYAAVKGSSLKSHPSSPFQAWEKYGYIPQDIQSQSVSITLEMAYDDWCVAQLAKKLGHMEDYDRFIRRSGFYRNLYDANSGFFRGKKRDGEWLEPFDPLKYSSNGDGPYTEGNAWQYLFYVPQDMPSLINLMGGKSNFNAKLDTFFTLDDTQGKKNANASGFIGQYAHGNEPSHHAAYLYNFSGQPWKTQMYVSRVLNELYNNSSAGYAGNEDCGQMSAWYVFSAMGFYPFNPVNGVYSLGSPLLQSAKIRLENGKYFTVLAQNAGKDNPYIQSVKLNGSAYTKTFITQNDIVEGGTLEFVMGSKPNLEWGVSETDTTASWGY